MSGPPTRFRVALSFAGAKRPYVAELAGVLATKLGKESVLYDAFHSGEFARLDLGLDYLPCVYVQDSDLAVTVFCEDFEANAWCGLEWIRIFDLLKHRQYARVMLCRTRSKWRGHVPRTDPPEAREYLQDFIARIANDLLIDAVGFPPAAAAEQEIDSKSWKADFAAAPPPMQKRMLRHASPRMFRMTTSAFLDLAKSLESMVEEEPVVSAFWDRREKLDSALRQERRG